MADRLARQRARKAAQDYMYGAGLRAESMELSDKFLAGKFACHVSTIKKVREHMPVSVLDPDDQRLIRQCVAERARIDVQLPRLTKAYLTKHYGISAEALDIELELAGWEDPRSKAGSAAPMESESVLGVRRDYPC